MNQRLIYKNEFQINARNTHQFETTKIPPSNHISLEFLEIQIDQTALRQGINGQDD